MVEAGVRLLVWCCLGLSLLLCQTLRAQTLDLHQASVTLRVDGLTTRKTVDLPYHWDRHHPGRQGEASFELQFELDKAPDSPWGIYLPRLGNAYEVWLNGVLLQHHGDMLHFNGADYAKAPRYIAITPGLLRSSNLIRINIRADVGRRGGLAPLALGPEEQVWPMYRSAYLWRITGSMVVAILSLLVGMAGLALWLTQVDPSPPGRRRWPRRDRLYLYAGMAELFWTLRISDAFIENPPLPWLWWGPVTVLAMAVWASSMSMFCLEVAGWRRLPVATWIQGLQGLVLVLAPLAAVAALTFGVPLALTLWYGLLAICCLVFMLVFMVWATRRDASLPHRLVAFAVLLNTLVGIRDLYAFRISAAYSDNTFQRYSSVLFGLALGIVVVLRFRAVSAQLRDLLATMAEQVAHKEQELARTYQRLEQLAREQARATERTQILRDMHDGVGSHISTAIRQLQSGKASRSEVQHTLRDSLDQLKLSIDAMNLPPGDINALLANIRYRLEPRFLACGIHFEWEVDLLEPVIRIDAGAMRQLQFMLFEALSNVLQHAQASILRVAARPSGPLGCGVCLQIGDNGRGFDALQSKRNGLRSMQERAGAIGVQLQIRSAPGRTVVEIAID